MKNALVVLLAFQTLSAFAKVPMSVSLNCRGQVRYGGYFSAPVFLPFDVLLKERLARKLVEVNNRDNDAEVSCSIKFNPKTFKSLNHEAFITITVERGETKESFQRQFSCPALVQDGGNQTLKKSCTGISARIIREILDEEFR
jgi:hypothetical protein